MDREDIIKALLNCITLKINDECLSHILTLYEKQIREKAIDECIKVFRSIPRHYYRDELLNELEQLKEHSNEIN